MRTLISYHKRDWAGAMGHAKMHLIKFVAIVTVCACLQSPTKALVAAENKSGAEPEWEAIVKKAKAEGQLNIYSGAIPALI
jgi:hypothetical protein